MEAGVLFIALLKKQVVLKVVNEPYILLTESKVESWVLSVTYSSNVSVFAKLLMVVYRTNGPQSTGSALEIGVPLAV